MPCVQGQEQERKVTAYDVHWIVCLLIFLTAGLWAFLASIVVYLRRIANALETEINVNNHY